MTAARGPSAGPLPSRPAPPRGATAVLSGRGADVASAGPLPSRPAPPRGATAVLSGRGADTPPDGLLSIGPYPLHQADTEDKFFGNRLIYIAWENHLMYAAPFCLPLPPSLPFGALVRDVLPELYGEHPEFEQIDWQRTEWSNSDQRFRPDFGKSLQHHGLAHKSLIRFRTPALLGIQRSVAPGRQAF